MIRGKKNNCVNLSGTDLPITFFAPHYNATVVFGCSSLPLIGKKREENITIHSMIAEIERTDNGISSCS